MAELKGRALIAYLLVCTVWGSTYLAIRVGVAELPALLFAGVRFLIAGLLLGGVVLALGQPLPRTRRDWTTVVVTGILLLVCGNAVVVWSEQFVESGPASVYVAAVPLWTAFFDTIVPGGSTRVTWRLIGGLALGFLGSALLAGATPAKLFQADLRGPIAITLASTSWAFGSVYTKRRAATTTPYVASAVQMVIAGAILIVAGLVTGQAAAWSFTTRGIGALAYLIVFGSIVGYTAYAYAIKHASPTLVGTYAYANPIVAVLLGWMILGESITARTVAAMALILGAVVLVQLAPQRRPAATALPSGEQLPPESGHPTGSRHAEPAA